MGRMKPICFFVDQLAGKRPRPCAACRSRTGAFGAFTSETDGLVCWWTAEDASGRTITFRVFPGKTPAWRLRDARREYRAAVRAALANEQDKRFALEPTRGRMWAYASTASAAFGARFPVKRFRSAAACEVLFWLASHRPDMAAIPALDELIESLETYA